MYVAINIGCWLFIFRRAFVDKKIHGLDIIHEEPCYGLYLDVYMLPTSSHERHDK